MWSIINLRWVFSQFKAEISLFSNLPVYYWILLVVPGLFLNILILKPTWSKHLTKQTLNMCLTTQLCWVKTVEPPEVLFAHNIQILTLTHTPLHGIDIFWAHYTTNRAEVQECYQCVTKKQQWKVKINKVGMQNQAELNLALHETTAH